MAIAGRPLGARTRYPRRHATDGVEEESSRGRAGPARRFERRQSSGDCADRRPTAAHRAQSRARTLEETAALGRSTMFGDDAARRCLNVEAEDRATPIVLKRT